MFRSTLTSIAGFHVVATTNNESSWLKIGLTEWETFIQTSIAGLNVASNNEQWKLLAQDRLNRMGDFHTNRRIASNVAYSLNLYYGKLYS